MARSRGWRSSTSRSVSSAALIAGRVATGPPFPLTTNGRRYRATVLPLGSRFDIDAVLVAGVAHRTGCDCVPRELPDLAVAIPAGGVHWAERCPRECPRCRPPFETLLSYQLERPVATPAA